MKRFVPISVAVAAALALPACASAPGSLARVTVIDRTANRELPVHWKDGRAYVAGKPGNEYAVRIRNVAGEDLLAVVSVDGVNAITGESARASQSGYVLGSYSLMDVSGTTAEDIAVTIRPKDNDPTPTATRSPSSASRSPRTAASPSRGRAR